jgi:hypothetical protein
MAKRASVARKRMLNPSESANDQWFFMNQDSFCVVDAKI